MKEQLKNNFNIDIDYRDVCKNIFCISIASKTYMHKEIDKIFNKNKLEYMKYFKKSNIYKSPLNETLLANVALYTEKVIGIVEKGLENEDYSEMFDLYKKANRKIYNHIKSSKSVTLKNLMKFLSVGIEGNYEFTSSIYMFSFLPGYNYDENDLVALKDTTDSLLQLAYYPQTNFSKKMCDVFSPEIQDIRKYLGLEKRSYNGEELIDTLAKENIKRYNASKVLTPWETIGKRNAYMIEKIGDIGKYIGAYEGLFKFLRINASDMMKNVTFSSNDINTILLNYMYSREFNTFKEEDRNIFIVSLFYFSALAKTYNKLKNTYLTTLNEEYLEEIDKLQNSLNESVHEAKQAKESFKNKEEHFNKREKELLDKIKQLEKDNKKLKKEIEDREPLKAEVVKLRNLVFDESNLNENEDELIEGEFNLDELNDKKVIILGGTESWVKYMKEKLPKATFAGTEFRNTKLDFIKKDSKVFINTKMSHAFYYKIREVLSKTNSDYYYINSSSNINNSLIYMKEQLSSN